MWRMLRRACSAKPHQQPPAATPDVEKLRMGLLRLWCLKLSRGETLRLRHLRRVRPLNIAAHPTPGAGAYSGPLLSST